MKSKYNMEEFWNIVHFFAFTFLKKTSTALDKISPVTLCLKTPAVKRFIIKRGGTIEMINDAADNVVNNQISGVNIWYAYLIMVSLIFLPCFALNVYYFSIFGMIKKFENFALLIVIYTAFSSIINYYLILHKGKCQKYFKKFRKQSQEWKVKWAWISAGTIILPVLMLIGSFVALSK
jgi:hypothetical protein